MRAIEAHGVLLVYPLKNRADIPSLWAELHPDVAMRWAWDQGADGRVVQLWQLREELSREREAVYAKWFRGRATFFSQPVFEAMLAALLQAKQAILLGAEARELCALLEEDSPQSTKQLRRAAMLTGRESERVFTRAMKELWERLLVVGVGEEDDGAFPSLRMGATRLLFEGLFERAQKGMTPAYQAVLQQHLAPETAFGRQFHKSLRAT